MHGHKGVLLHLGPCMSFTNSLFTELLVTRSVNPSVCAGRVLAVTCTCMEHFNFSFDKAWQIFFAKINV